VFSVAACGKAIRLVSLLSSFHLSGSNSPPVLNSMLADSKWAPSASFVRPEKLGSFRKKIRLSQRAGFCSQQKDWVCFVKRSRSGSHRFCWGSFRRVCGRTPSDAHHVKFAAQRAMGRKVSDRFTVPICRLHHRELHRRGNEREWWESQGIDPLIVAASLWGKTHAPVSAEPGDEPIPNGKRNGRCVENGAGVVGQLQNCETKPILGPEAE